jgi:hypothetical protein
MQADARFIRALLDREPGLSANDATLRAEHNAADCCVCGFVTRAVNCPAFSTSHAPFVMQYSSAAIQSDRVGADKREFLIIYLKELFW